MRDRTLVGVLALLLLAALYLLVSSPGLRDAVNQVLVSTIRPMAIPVVEAINNPAFVYLASTAIVAVGVLACLLHRFRSVSPRLAELRQVRAALGDLPVPRLMGGPRPKDWAVARQGLGAVLVQNSIFVAPWSSFQAEAVRGRGIPSRPFSSFLDAEPERRSAADEVMQALPGYFTSIGLIFTFVGLVVALYFAAKGFRTGDIAEARAAIIQLLNAASFKFLTSVSALIAALIVSLYARYAGTLLRQGRLRTLERIEIYLADWREQIGSGRPEQRLEPADLLRRFDDLLAAVATLSSDLKLVVERRAAPADGVPAVGEGGAGDA